MNNIKTYQNIYNPNKYIEIKHSNDRHYFYRQYIKTFNGGKNYLASPSGRGRFYRFSIKLNTHYLNTEYRKVIGG